MPSTPPERPDNEVWDGRWCWTRKHMPRPWNHYAYFRRVVNLPGKPRNATIRVSADARYTLYVNAQRVHQGPARSFPQFQSFDTLDLSSFLQAGQNTVCIVAHQFGVPTFQSVYRDASGIIVDGVIDIGHDRIALHTPEGWLCRDAKGWRKDTVRLSIQNGFQEHFDADADPGDWMLPNFQATEEDGWKKPVNLGPAGIHPWVQLEERAVPLLAQQEVKFQAIIGQFTGENVRGYKVASDVYHLPEQESRKRDKSFLEKSDAMLRDDGETTTVLPPPDGNFVMAVLDLGQERAGHVMLDIAEAHGDEIIDILYSEDIDPTNAPRLIPPGAHCEEATADRYRCRPGAQTWEPFFYKGFRYATLVFRNVEAPLRIRNIALRQVHAGLEDLGSFECSDPQLNRIWQVGRETLRYCMFDAYVDCPWREQAQWWGDARVQFKANQYSFGDVSLFQRGIRQVMQSQASDGSLHSHPPSDCPSNRLPDYMLVWVGSLWDYYFHTGKMDLLRECLPALHRVVAFFTKHEMKEGLIGGFDGYWLFIDWQTLYRGDLCGPLNLLYLEALRWAAAICQIVKDPAADAYVRKVRDLATAITKHFWDPKNKVWKDGYDLKADVQVDEVSQHMNALAMMLRLKPETHAALARDVLLKAAQSKRGKVLTASPFFYAYVLEALAETGLRDEVIGVVREKWGAMIERGATTFWEIWDAKNESRCHAWSASPVYHLSQQILGVVPVDVAWKHIQIAPLPAGLDDARGVVPTPLGHVRVEWEKAAEDQLAVRIELPQGMKAEFISPSGETRALGPGVHELHT